MALLAVLLLATAGAAEMMEARARRAAPRREMECMFVVEAWVVIGCALLFSGAVSWTLRLFFGG